MKIKSKLILGIGLLFAMVLLLTALSTFFITRLKADTTNILVANYNTLDYSRLMLIALNNGINNPKQIQQFQQNLAKQQSNISEVGEASMTQKLTLDFNNLLAAPQDAALKTEVTTDITNIMLLNMQAIQRKSQVAEATATSAISWVAFVGTVCFLIALTLLFNLPSNIANPIKELTHSIKAIANQNYSQRIHFEKHNEFGELSTAFNTMAQKLEEYKTTNLEKLMIEKKRNETLINNMSDPVIGLNDENIILFMNDIALKIVGLKSEEVIGKPVQDVAVQNDLLRSLIQDLFASKKPSIAIKQPPIKIYANNKESYFEKQLIPIKIIPTGEKIEKHIGNVILLHNITPFKELDSAKTNFIATVSHELKTPISSIKMSLQLLQNKQVGSINEEQQSLIESISDDASRLLKITSELLNMTQVESGSVQLNIRPTPAQEIVDYAVNANKSAAEQKQIKFSFKNPVTPVYVLADSEKTAWVLTNLISNAIRYSYDDAVVYLDVAETANKIKITVTDSGQGIAPNYLPKIFDRYFKVPGTRKEGTGLGLSISKELIEAQGGAIEVKSDFGAGSSFTILLPLQPNNVEAPMVSTP